MKKPQESTDQKPITEVGIFANGPIPRQIHDVISFVREVVKCLQRFRLIKRLPESSVHPLKSPPDKIDMGIGIKVSGNESWNNIHASLSGTMRAIGFAIVGVFLAGGALGYCARSSCDSKPSEMRIP